MVASRGCWPAFAPLVAATAWTQGLQGAARRAFVGDGSANNWALQRRFFGSFVPIMDFITQQSMLRPQPRRGGRVHTAGWACYREWISWLWQGKVRHQVIAALQERQAELGLPEKDEAETSPRQVVSKTLTYLENPGTDAVRRHRQQGLPLTNSLMESAVKQINQRQRERKFWSEAGSEAVLQLRADQAVTRSRWPPSGNGGRRPRDNAVTAVQADYRPCRAPCL